MAAGTAGTAVLGENAVALGPLSSLVLLHLVCGSDHYSHLLGSKGEGFEACQPPAESFPVPNYQSGFC